MIKEVIHFHPLLCDAFNGSFKVGDSITASKDIEKVTCQKCMYYHFRPEAKVLNDAWRNRK